MRALLRGLVRLVEWWSVALLVLMVGIVVVGVLFRYVLDASLAWYDEFASYLMVWLTFYGAVVVSYRRRHISFETLAESLGPKGRRAVGILAELLVLAFQVILAYWGWIALDAMAFDTAVSLTWVRMTWVYSVLPISGALMLLISVVHLADVIRGVRPSEPKAPLTHTAE